MSIDALNGIIRVVREFVFQRNPRCNYLTFLICITDVRKSQVATEWEISAFASRIFISMSADIAHFDENDGSCWRKNIKASSKSGNCPLSGYL